MTSLPGGSIIAAGGKPPLVRMTWTPSTFTLLGVGAGAISTMVAGYALAHRDDRTTTSFALMMMIFAVWSFDYAIQLGFTTRSEQVFLQGLTLGVAGVFPTAWLVFVFQYSGYVPEVSGRWLAVLLVEPVDARPVTRNTSPWDGLVVLSIRNATGSTRSTASHRPLTSGTYPEY